jgi:hypothetical protein
MIEYLKLKIFEEDWHGVCDAGMDLRDLSIEEKYNLTEIERLEDSK